MGEAEAGKEQVQQRLLGKAALVTGGGSGIGRASALLYAKHGAKVCVLDRGIESAQEVCEEIERLGGEGLALHADVSSPEDMRLAVDKAVQHYGRLDIVMANAGINGVMNAIEHMSVEDWEHTVNINLKGTFLTVKYAIPYLKQQGGSIIITSSVNGNRIFSNFGFSTYSTSKAGQVAFMKMAALELARYRIRVNAICPGGIKTNIGKSTQFMPEVEEIRIPVHFPEGSHPLEQKPGSAEQVADLALFLASRESSHISGTEIYIDGAESLLRG